MRTLRRALGHAAVRHAEELTAVLPVALVPRAHHDVHELRGAAIATVVVDLAPLAVFVPDEVAVLRELVQVTAGDDVQQDAAAGERVERGGHARGNRRVDEPWPESDEELDALGVLSERRRDHPPVEAHLAGRHEHPLEAGGLGGASHVHEVVERRLDAGGRIPEASLVAHRRHEPEKVHGRRGYWWRPEIRRPWPVASTCDRVRSACAVRALPDGLLPRGRREDRPLQLDLRAPARWHVRAAHRRHRHRAQPRRVDRRHPERAAVDRRRLGRGPVLPEPAHHALCRRRRPPLRERQGVLLRLHARGHRRADEG